VSLFAELKRRNVIRVVAAYLAISWLLIQIADTVFPRIGLGETAITGVIALLAIGFLPALMLSWVFEWTSEGFRREREVTAETPRHSTEGVDRAITVTLILAVAYFAVDKFVIDPARDAAEIEAARMRLTDEAAMGTLFRVMAWTHPDWADPAGFTA